MGCRVTELLCLLGSQGAQRIINHLMLLDEGKPDKSRGNDQRLEVRAILSQNFDKRIGKPLLNE